MPKKLDELMVVRVPQDTVKRADDLVPFFMNDEHYQGIAKISRSMILRLALLEGLRTFEKRYARQKPG
ncbi:MAG TPA: hypothetical protein PK360_03490 [bacterium]|nr:hypothetical protein [bacterium]